MQSEGKWPEVWVSRSGPHAGIATCTLADPRWAGHEAARYIPATTLEAVERERDELRGALAEMEMPMDGVGTAWPTEYCSFCKWEGKADRMIAPEKQTHEPECPIAKARAALNPSQPEEAS